MTSSPVAVFGSGGPNSILSMRFYLPHHEDGLNVQWYGQTIGSPGILVANLYPDAGGSINTNVIEAGANTSASFFSGSVWLADSY